MPLLIIPFYSALKILTLTTLFLCLTIYTIQYGNISYHHIILSPNHIIVASHHIITSSYLSHHHINQSNHTILSPNHHIISSFELVDFVLYNLEVLGAGQAFFAGCTSVLEPGRELEAASKIAATLLVLGAVVTDVDITA